MALASGKLWKLKRKCQIYDWAEPGVLISAPEICKIELYIPKMGPGLMEGSLTPRHLFLITMIIVVIITIIIIMVIVITITIFIPSSFPNDL